MRDKLPNLAIETVTLGNGLEVILHHDASVPVAAVNIWYHVGSKNERRGRSGFAHLFEHMMFQGSAHQDTEYFGPLQEIGAQLNGSTSTDRTNYWEVAPSNHLERLLLMEADRMGWLVPAMTQGKLDNQRDVVRNERRQTEGNPYSVFRLEFNRLMYPVGHPYDHSVIGEHEDLEAASLEDVTDFFQTFYIPNNASLCVAGDFDKEQTLGWIEQYFGEIPPGEPVEEIKVWVPELEQEKRVALKDRVQLTRLHTVWHTPPVYQAGDAELDLAAQVLGQGRTSRLYRRLVHEKKLAQDVGAWQASSQIASTFQIHTTLRPEADPQEVERIIDEEINTFRAHGPTQDELDRVVNSFEAAFVKALQRVGSFGGKSDLLNAYNHYLGTPDYLQQDLTRYLEATPASIQQSVNRWLGDGRMVCAVEPAGALEASQPVAEVNRGTLPQGSEPRPLALPQVQTGTLPNGLSVISMKKSELPLVRMELVFRSGVRDDTPAKSGLVALANDMLLSGTKHMDKFQFSEALEHLGTDMGTSVGTDYAGLSMVALTKHLQASFKMMAEAQLEPAFDEHELEHERSRRILNIQREVENPWQLMSRVTRRVVYGKDHPYGLISTGTIEAYESFTPQNLHHFAGEHFTPENAFLLAVGDVEHGTVMDLAQEFLGDWKGEAPGRAPWPDPAEHAERTVYLVDKPGDSQSTLALTHLGVSRSNGDWEALYLANRILGGMFTSRLNLNLREDKGYTYGAWSQFTQSVHPGIFSMGGRVQTEVTGPALAECIKELTDIHANRPITAEELKFAKNSVIREYPGEFETVSEIADAIAEQAIYDLPMDYIEQYPQRIQEATLSEVREAAKKYLHPERVAVIVVGDLKQVAEPVRELNLGPTQIVDLASIGLPAS